MESEKMSEALRLAELIDNDLKNSAHHVEAAAELRRLHALVMDKQGEIYGLTFARETERKIHGLVKVECGALRARADALQRWHDQQLDRSEKAEAERDALRVALQGIVEFADAPVEGKRPDVFALRINKARAALKEVK